jgi:hypothetical protein
LAYEQADQDVEHGILIGALSGGAAGAARGAATDAGANSTAAGVAESTVGQAAQYALATQTDLGMQQHFDPATDIDPSFEAYMKELNKGYSPQIQEVINPMVLAAVGNGTEVNPTQLTQSTGISPLLQGA